ncbi:hypothetical protein SUDANB15_06202 [Streptomyces sp. enrichment culture]|uniref:hypothetical protein n=1 Tax=Streptomyces sp. enrichment culture TaxID=1795815 RepID=UPI003F57DCC2
MTKSRRAREARQKRASFAGREQYSGEGEPKAADMQPWKFTASDVPKISAGTLDAPAILKSINETLLPAVEEKLERVVETLGALLEGSGAEDDPVGAIRAELMRRILPQISDSVRSGVMEGMRTRQMHLAQLAAIHRQTLESKSLRVVLARIDHELLRAGLEIVGKADDHSQFNVVEDPPGAMSCGPVVYEVAAPAYVDRESGKLVERGWLRAVPKSSLSVPAAEKMKPGQKRRATHTEAGEKQKRGLEGGSGDSSQKKKAHRGQAPSVPQGTSDSSLRENRKRDQGAEGGGKAEGSQVAKLASASNHPQGKESAVPSRRRSKGNQSEQCMMSPRSEESSDRQVPEKGPRGSSWSPTGSQDKTEGDRAQKKTSYRQSLRAAASKRMNQRGTR